MWTGTRRSSEFKGCINMNFVIGVTGIDVITKWSSILTPDAKVVILTLNTDVPYYRAPWLCVDSVIIQRKYETRRALNKFGINDISFLNYPSFLDIDLERTLPYFLLNIGLYRVTTVYCERTNETLSLLCDSLQKMVKVISVGDIDFMSKQKGESLLEFTEILYSKK